MGANRASSPAMQANRWWWRPEGAIQWAVALVVVFLILAPVVPLLMQSFSANALYAADNTATLANFHKLLTDPAFGSALVNSLLFAVGGTVLAQAIGAVAAVLVGRTDMALRGMIGTIVIWPVFISHLVITTGWSIVYGPAGYFTMLWKQHIGTEFWSLYTIAGMALVAAVTQVPIAFLYCLGSLRSSDPTLEDSARAAGLRPMQIFRRITLPLLRPALLVSGILNFVMMLEAVSIPLVFGRPAKIELLMSYIYERSISVGTPDYGLVASAATLLVILVLVLVIVQRSILKNPQRFVTIGGKAQRPRQFALGRWKWPAAAIMCAYLLLFVLLPLAGVVGYAFAKILTPLVPLSKVMTLANFETVFTTATYRRAIFNSVVISVVGGAITTVIVTLLALVAHRSKFRFGRELDIISLLPRAVPGMIAGIGIFYVTVLITPLGWMRQTIFLLMIAFAMRYIPLGYGAVATAIMKIDPQLDRSARAIGADWWFTARRVVIPLLLPAMMSSYALLFVYFFKDYSTGVFLVAPGSEVMGTTMLQMFLSGQTGPAAAMATIQLVLTMVFVVGLRRLTGVSMHG
ncbi:iron ABC transporter permease [Mesorhizobium sp. BE184]|uniref:ABC transporter permease n=1 Tax=Mesorhizobium sp. BE184 TaxID=2817714 RepID=UPI00286441F7|nr:iron ABC transporter permease [Mesorhizobium sp. BE184]MDR7034149.1 iron(III) transport system permease protein [Mesorhizobium sp. BE184]